VLKSSLPSNSGHLRDFTPLLFVSCTQAHPANTAAELNLVTDEALHARIDAAVGATPLPIASGLPPMAASFITLAMLSRVRERLVHRVRDGHTCGWLLLASLARAVADLTGAPKGIPPNDWRAQKFGNSMNTAIDNYFKRRRKARFRRRPEVRAQVERAEDETCYTESLLALEQPPPKPPSEPPASAATAPSTIMRAPLWCALCLSHASQLPLFTLALFVHHAGAGMGHGISIWLPLSITCACTLTFSLLSTNCFIVVDGHAIPASLDVEPSPAPLDTVPLLPVPLEGEHLIHHLLLENERLKQAPQVEHEHLRAARAAAAREEAATAADSLSPPPPSPSPPLRPPPSPQMPSPVTPNFHPHPHPHLSPPPFGKDA
jgi:hypothetical protein